MKAIPYMDTIAPCVILLLNSVAFTDMFLPEACTHEKSGQPGCRRTCLVPEDQPPMNCGSEAAKLPDGLREIPDEKVKASVGFLVITIFLDVTTSIGHMEVDAQQEALACRD